MFDWTRGAGRPAHPRAEGVDVIIPVYGAAEELRRCLASVGRWTDLTRSAVIIVVDGPQEAAVEAALATFPRARVLRNETRLGFVGSVNRGMAESRRDVVLLNSDTVVTPQWLEKLSDAAASCGDVGTVTPLSNRATLLSVPRPFEENLLPAGHDAASFAALVERVSLRAYPRLPTGVGFCLYIRRALLDEVGLFDAERFGLGYGEENDFCMRALSRGWIHIADDATFVEHSGHGSFGASRHRLRRAAGRMLRRRHPEFRPAIARFMRLDPLAPVRQRIHTALRERRALTRPRGPRRVVHVVHGWPPFATAGTEVYAHGLVTRQMRWRDVSVFARIEDRAREQGEAVELSVDGARVRLVTNNFKQRNPLSRNALRDGRLDRAFARFLEEEKPDLLHIHHLGGHAFSLADVGRRAGIPIVQQLQDWWAMCARVSLLDAGWQRCSGPALAKCARCAPLTGVAPAAAWNLLLHAARKAAAREALRAADAYVMGSQAIRDDYAREGLFRSGRPLFVLPYGVEPGPVRQPRPPLRRPVRFGFIGSTLPHKGLHVAIEAFHGTDAGEARLQAWGSLAASPSYTDLLRERAQGVPVTLSERFREEEKEEVFAAIDVLLVPSIGLESYGLTAREALARGIPVVASWDGAQKEMFEPGTCGAFFPPGDAAALHAIIRTIIDSPRIVDEWASRIAPVKSADEHAEEIEEVYERVLAVRR